MKLPFFMLFCSLFLMGAGVGFSQRNDLPTGSRKENATDDKLNYEKAIRLYGSPDQEKQMKDGSLVCTWTQTLGIQGETREGLAGGNTMKMVIFFSKDGVMTDRKFRNCPVFFPDSVFRLK